jgi:hypothetical protein
VPTSISKKRWLRELREGLWKRLENMAIGKEALSTRRLGKKDVLFVLKLEYRESYREKRTYFMNRDIKE